MSGAAWKGRADHARRLGRSIARNPRQGLEEGWEDVLGRFERPAPAVQIVGSPDWERQLHAQLGAPWPCPHLAELEPIWSDMQAKLREDGLKSGRGAYGGWDDGDQALSRAVWCAVRHVRAERVVETGVARGITSRTVLEALERNGDGRLWSIDLPLPPHLATQGLGDVGSVVPASLHERWTLIRGSSRRRLPRLLEELNTLDLFIHDSLHSERNMRFELSAAWPMIKPGGVMIVDDVERNAGFHRWAAHASGAHTTICQPDDHEALFAVVVKQVETAPS